MSHQDDDEGDLEQEVDDDLLDGLGAADPEAAEETSSGHEDEGDVRGNKRKHAQTQAKGRGAAAKAGGGNGTSGKGKGGTRGGAKAGAGRKPMKKGERACSCCQWVMANDLFPKGSDKCPPCKRGANNIYNASVAQGQLEWYHEQMNCSVKRKRLLKNYQNLHPEPPEGQNRKPCQLLALKSSIKAESGIDKMAMGEMMWIGHAIHNFQKPKNGSMDADEIKQMFKAECRKEGSLTDQLGPKKAPLRVWLKTKDAVNFRESFLRSKDMEVTESTNKKATQDDLDKAFSWVQSNMDKAGRINNGLNMQDMAANMLKASSADGTGAWDAAAADLTRGVRDLVPEDAAPEDKSKGQGDEDGEGELDGDAEREDGTEDDDARTVSGRSTTSKQTWKWCRQ